MRVIKLHSKKYPGLVALVDDKDYELVNQYDWYPHRSKHTFYARGKIPGKGSGGRRLIYMHRLLLNAQPDERTDHKNHNGLDNRRKTNLRICTDSQNHANEQSHIGMSKFKGVVWYKRDQKWQAQIKLNRKCIYLGRFNDEVRAAKVYDKKAVELFGEFALTNF